MSSQLYDRLYADMPFERPKGTPWERFVEMLRTVFLLQHRTADYESVLVRARDATRQVNEEAEELRRTLQNTKLQCHPDGD